MTVDAGFFNELKLAFKEASILLDGGIEFVHLPVLRLPDGCQPPVVEALLCPQMRDGYMTRLFLSSQVPSPAQNWTEHHILGRRWYSWSWQNVSADQSLVQILLGHLEIFR